MKTLLDEKSLKNRIIGLLARREYSRVELTHRLKPLAESEILLASVLDALAKDGYQSDLRYTQSFIRQRVSQFWGPKRIVYELKQKGIATSMIDLVLEEMSPEWNALAYELATKRIDRTRSLDLKERAKQTRYMLNQGFSYDHVDYALKMDSA